MFFALACDRNDHAFAPTGVDDLVTGSEAQFLRSRRSDRHGAPPRQHAGPAVGRRPVELRRFPPEARPGARRSLAEVDHEVIGDLLQESTLQTLTGLAVERPLPGVREVEPLARPGDADVRKPPLLFEARRIRQRAIPRKHPFFHPCQEHDIELESLRGVQRQKANAPARVVKVVGRGDEGDCLQEGLDVLVARCHAAELVEVLEPTLGVDRSRSAELCFRLEGFAVPGPLQDRVDDLEGRASLQRRELADEPQEPADRRKRPTRDTGVLRVRDRVGKRHLVVGRVSTDLRQGRVADSSLRHVDHAPQRHLVEGVYDEAEVSENVAHLAPVVKACPADHLVRDTTIRQSLFDRPALRIAR